MLFTLLTGTISTSVGNVQPRHNYNAKTVHRQTHNIAQRGVNECAQDQRHDSNLNHSKITIYTNFLRSHIQYSHARTHTHTHAEANAAIWANEQVEHFHVEGELFGRSSTCNVDHLYCCLTFICCL